MSRRQFLRAGTLAGGTLLLASYGGALAGCATGGSAGGAGGGGAKSPLKVGVLVPLSKVYALLGEGIANGATQYFESVNFTAGGRRIELIKEDSEADPPVGVRKARKLIEQDKVDIILGVVSSAVAYGVRDVVHNAKTPLFVCTAFANDLTRSKRSPYIFRVAGTSHQCSAPMGAWVYENVGKRVFLAAADYAAGRENMAAFKEPFVKAGGTVVGELYPPLGTNDYGAYLTQIAQAKPDVVYAFFAGSDAVRFVKQYDEYGLKKDIKLTGLGFMFDENELIAQGKAAVGGYSGHQWAPTLPGDVNKKFVQTYREKWKKEPDLNAESGYNAARVIVEAVNKLQGDLSNKDRFIETVAGVKFEAPRGPIEFDPETHQVIHNIYVRRVVEEGGKVQNSVVHTFPKVSDPGQ